MNDNDTRPLSDLYSEEQRRRVVREFDRIRTLHRANYAAHQLTIAAKLRSALNELDIRL